MCGARNFHQRGPGPTNKAQRLFLVINFKLHTIGIRGEGVSMPVFPMKHIAAWGLNKLPSPSESAHECCSFLDISFRYFASGFCFRILLTVTIVDRFLSLFFVVMQY